MPDLVINGSTYHAKEVFKIAQGKELDAVNAGKKSGADDLFFRIGGDVYAASARNLRKGLVKRSVKPGDAVSFQARTGRVLILDDKLNSAIEGVKKTALPAFLLGAVSFLMLGWLGIFGIGAGILWVAGAALYGALRPANTRALAPFAEQVAR